MRFISASLTRSSSFYARISGSESGSLVSSSFTITTHKYLGGFDGDFTDGKVVFTVPSQSAGGSADVKALIISASGNNPRVGIGVDKPLKAFDFKEVSDTNRGGEILIRGSRTTKGAEPNDEVGRINFIIDSSSYLKVETSGSAAEIIAFADEVDASGIKGSLSFRVSAQKTEGSVERLRITPDGTIVTGSFTVSGSNSFINIGPAEFTGSVSITNALTAYDVNSTNLDISHFGQIDALRVGTGTDPGTGVLSVQDYGLFFGGIHVGGASDPGADNLLVDGTTTLVGTTIISGSTLNMPNLTAGSVGSDYDKLLIVDSSGQVRTLADSSVPFTEVFDGVTPTNQTLVMFSGSTGNTANATGISYNSATGWNFSNVGSAYDITVDDIIVTNALTVTNGTFTGDLSADNGSFSGNLTVDGNVTANQYIVSSSVTYMTQSFSSGSTIFGDTLDDTHQFTGSIDVNGSITASGEIETNTVSTVTTVIGSDSITNVDTFATSTYNGAIYDYILKDSTVGARAGQFMVAHDDGDVTFTDTSTKHLSDSTIPEITADISEGSTVRVRVTNGNGYTFKSFVKKL